MKRLLTAALLVANPTFLAMATPILASESTMAPEVSLDDMKKLVEAKDATILDANSEVSYDKGHIPGAVNYSKNAKKLASVLPKDKSATVVAYCGGPLCTAWEDAANAVKALGYTNIKHFKGGIKTWTDAGQKVEKGS